MNIFSNQSKWDSLWISLGLRLWLCHCSYAKRWVLPSFDSDIILTTNSLTLQPIPLFALTDSSLDESAPVVVLYNIQYITVLANSTELWSECPLRGPNLDLHCLQWDYMHFPNTLGKYIWCLPSIHKRITCNRNTRKYALTLSIKMFWGWNVCSKEKSDDLCEKHFMLN